MEYNYTTTGSTALRASMQIFTDETYTEAYLGLFEIHNVSNINVINVTLGYIL